MPNGKNNLLELAVHSTSAFKDTFCGASPIQIRTSLFQSGCFFVMRKLHYIDE